MCIGCQLDELYGFADNTGRMQQCFNTIFDIYNMFLLTFHSCILLEIKEYQYLKFQRCVSTGYLLLPSVPSSKVERQLEACLA